MVQDADAAEGADGEEEEEEFITSGDWMGKHNSRRRRRRVI